MIAAAVVLTVAALAGYMMRDEASKTAVSVQSSGAGERDELLIMPGRETDLIDISFCTPSEPCEVKAVAVVSKAGERSRNEWLPPYQQRSQKVTYVVELASYRSSGRYSGGGMGFKQGKEALIGMR